MTCPTHGQVPPNVATSDCPNVAGSRILPLPVWFDFGEQVVGSAHALPVAALQKTAASPNALVVLEVKDTSVLKSRQVPFVSASSGPPLMLGTGPESLNVQFAPTARGAFNAQLRVRLHWVDGSFETHVIELRGRGRELDDAPTRVSNAADASPHTTGAAAGVRSPRLDHAANEAKVAIDGVLDRQKEGVTLAEKQAAAFEAKSNVPDGLVGVLAGVAVTAGVGAISGAIASFVVPRVVALVASSQATNADTVAAATKVVKDGLQKAAEFGIAKLMGADEEDGDESHLRIQYSRNRRIDFFEQQRDVLPHVLAEQKTVIDHHRDLLSAVTPADEELAVTAMEELGRAAARVRDEHAKLLQARATERAWVSFVSQHDLGAQTILQGRQKRVVTRMEKASEGSRGVVNVHVAVPNGNNALTRARVTAASLKGISKEIAMELASRPLRDAGVPVQLHVASGLVSAVVRMDESGRVRVRGALAFDLTGNPQQDVTSSEEQMIAVGEMLCDRLLSKSLDEWGIELRTNDKTGLT